MRTYVDSSVLLRAALRPRALTEWKRIGSAVASALVQVECHRTLDAIHLATALLWREQRNEELTFATHDAALGTAARAYGMTVIGVG